jgi:ribosomal subunit interface protein
MQQPLQITFRNLDRSPAIEAKIRERAAKLEKYCDRIMGCRVAVEALHRHRRHGNLYHVRIDVTVPGAELVASREPDEHHAYTDVYVAIRDAFDSMRRQLEDYVRRSRGQVKTHAAPPQGTIVELDAEQGYGRIESSDGRLVYFHRNSLLDADFDRLAIGTKVIFVEEMGERGPQASTVRLAGRHRLAG